MNKNGIVSVVVVITAVVLVGLWVMRSGQNRPGGRQFDCSAPPDPPTNLIFTKDGTDVRGTWTPPGGDDAPTTYVVEVGSRPGLNDQGTFVVPATQTHFGGPTPAGSYYGRVYARNACGSSPASNEINFSVP
ncbi:MAG TPA: fibronectin type III domain-containing protein [Vicinamibacterales bacterium]|nr:fibronectin type III domain-containing protein [Vicinamibacterales bacterium]